MYNLGYIILSMTMVATTIWIVYKFLGTFLKKKKSNFFMIILWFAFGLFQFYVEQNKGVASIWTTVINSVLILSISLTGYIKSAKIKILFSLILVTIWSISEMIVFIYLDNRGLSEQEFDIIGAVLTKIIMIIGVYACSIYWRKKSCELITTKYYIVLLFISIGSIYIAINEFYSKKENYNIFSSMIVYSFLLLLNIIIFEIYSKLSENFWLENEKAIYAQQINIISRSTKEQKQIMEDFHEERHNWVNELIVLKNEVENSDRTKVVDSLNQIINAVNISEKISNTGNSTIDAIINFKYAIAKEQGIEFHLKAFIPTVLPFDQCDLGIILGNSIDNAMEAVMKCKVNNRIIEISMGIKKEALVLIVKNPCEHSLKRDKLGNLLSTKKESKHGYGVASIKRVTDKYQGAVITEIQGDIFVIMIIMNLGDFNSKHHNFDS